MSKPVTRTITAVLAVAAAVAVAAMVMAGLRYRDNSSALERTDRPILPEPLVFSGRDAQRSGGPAAATQPDEALVQSLLGQSADGRIAEAGVRLVDADPEGVAPPPDSRRLAGVQQLFDAGRQELGRYLAKGSASALESFYDAAMPAGGWQRVERAGRADLVFQRPRQTCLIRLTPAGQDTEVCVVVWTRTD